MLEVMYSLTKQDLWESHKHETKKAFLRVPIFYAVLWIGSIVFWWVALAAFLHLFEGDFLLCLAISLLQCLFGVFGLILNRRKAYFKEIAKNLDLVGQRIIRVGKHDLFWGSTDAIGYYYHLSALSDIVETPTYFCLIVQGKNTLVIPKSAFMSGEAAQAFGAEVRARWETAKHKQRYQDQETEGAWPPAPRPKA